MAKTTQEPRNAGPSWGFAFLLWAKRNWPDGLFRWALGLGVWCALVLMPVQRHHSRQYLRQALNRRPGWKDCFRHFMAFTESLIFKLEVAEDPDRMQFKMAEAGYGDRFYQLVRSDQPALFGTFHVGHSDLLGCVLSRFDRKIKMVRQRVGNSHDMALLQRAYSDHVDFVWINEGESMLFALKSVADDGASIALQCDREHHASRHHAFDFLGVKRRFPVTIYHLSYIFRFPVVFSFAIPDSSGCIQVVCSDVFEPVEEAKKTHLNAGYEHFQSALNLLEEQLRQHPYFWFNFIPLNSKVSGDVA